MSHTNPIANSAAQGTGLDTSSKAKLQKAVRDFESIMMGYMLKSMRSSMSSEGMFGESFGGDVLDGMFDTEFASAMSKNSSLGIAEMLYRKMTGEDLPTAKTVPGHHEGTKVPPSKTTVPVAPQASAVASPAPAAEKNSPPAPIPPTIKKEAVVRPAVEQPVSPRHVSSSVEGRVDQYSRIIQEASDMHGVSPHLLKAVIATESGGNANAQSGKNAKGLMQLIDSTATAMGAQNVWDPRENILAGAKYLQQLLGRFAGNVEHALASYNAGPAAVEKHGGVPPYPETKDYVKKVMTYLRYFEQADGASNGQD